MLTINKLAEEFKPFHNHIGILHDLELVRILGVGEDDDDYYYICSSIHRGRYDVFKSTACGWLYSLKGMIPDDRYEQIDGMFEANGSPKTDSFKVEYLEPF